MKRTILLALFTVVCLTITIPSMAQPKKLLEIPKAIRSISTQTRKSITLYQTLPIVFTYQQKEYTKWNYGPKYEKIAKQRDILNDIISSIPDSISTRYGNQFYMNSPRNKTVSIPVAPQIDRLTFDDIAETDELIKQLILHKLFLTSENN